MKRMLLILTVLLGWSAAQADDYMPLLREGVKWVYTEEYHDIFNINDGDVNLSDNRKYIIELRGDTIIAGMQYKNCYRVCETDVDWSELKFSKSQPVACLREDGQKVYGRMLKYSKNLDFETIYWQNVDSEMNGIYWNDELNCSDEGLIYDFESPKDFNLTSFIDISGQQCSVFHHYIQGEACDDKIVEGIGYDDDKDGDLLCPLMGYKTGMFYTTTGLHHMEDADGNIIYKGAAYSYAQADYRPFVEEGKVWNMRCEVSAISDGAFEDYDFSYFIQGDTVINGMSAKKVYSVNEDNTGAKVYKMAVFEQDRNVFFFAPGSDKQYVLYDFSGKAGDQVTLAAVINENPWTVTMEILIDKIVNIRSADRRAYLVRWTNTPNEDNGWYNGWWIEGIGSELGPFNRFGFGLDGLNTIFLSCEVNGEVIFDQSDISLLVVDYDLNGDGMVDVEDVNAVVNIALKLSTAADYPGNADLDGNGIVDVEDVNALVNKILKLQ